MKRKNIPKEQTEFARHLRRAQTPAEDLLWQLLRNRRSIPKRFRRQQPIGPYIVDLYCHDYLLVVECDGDPHLTEAGIAHDRARDEYLRRLGFTVLRFENREVESDAQSVISRILAWMMEWESKSAAADAALHESGGAHGGRRSAE